jgi:glycosyltransferase involved in cell wall biosynthesis
MRILQVHNEYRAPGGEETVLELEHDLLQSKGHQVGQFIVSNVDLLSATLRTGIETTWSHRSYKKLRKVLRQSSPDLMHVHNTFPLLSPSVYWAAAMEGIPVVQTWHNYRLVCANGLLLRDLEPCELCVGRVPLPALRYKCYRGSVPATGAVVAMQVAHRILGTYLRKVDAHIALTEFERSVVVRYGVPAESVHVKPNFVPDPSSSLSPSLKRKKQVVFVGRLAFEKGVDMLLEAWGRLKLSGFELIIAGDGPDRANLERKFADLPGLVWRGWVDRAQVLREIAQSSYLIMSSRWYEGLPMVLVEALSVGTPLILPNHAQMPDNVTSGGNSLLFAPGSVEDLTRVLRQALRIDDAVWQRWSANSRDNYLAHFTPEMNYRQLMNVYRRATEHARGQGCE